MKVAVALRQAVVVDDLDFVDQFGGDDATAGECFLFVLAKFLIELKVGFFGAKGVDLPVLTEHGDAHVIQFKPAVVVGLKILGGHHHVLAFHFQLERPLELRAFRPERLTELFFQFEAARRHRPQEIRPTRIRQVCFGQRRQAVDAAEAAGVEQIAGEENEEAQRQQYDPLGGPHGLVPSRSRRGVMPAGSIRLGSAGSIRRPRAPHPYLPAPA